MTFAKVRSLQLALPKHQVSTIMSDVIAQSVKPSDYVIAEAVRCQKI